jgi:parvulin-like peptidyl-prolyl isomerase
MLKRTVGAILIAMGVAAFAGAALAAEAPEPKAEEPKKTAPAKEAEPPKKAEEPKAPAPKREIEIAEGDKEDVVAKVDNTVIKRSDLIEERRQIALSDPQRAMPNNETILEGLINRVLFQRYIEKEKLAASGADVQGAIQNLDGELRRRGATYQKFLEERSLTAESHAGRIRYELSLRRLIDRIANEIAEEQVKAEFDARPEYYDGCRVRISQIFVDTSNISHDAKKVEEAKQKIDKCYAELKAGKEFKTVANDFSEDPAAAKGGDRGWFVRQAGEEDEPLIAAAWKLKVGEHTEPIRGVRGWHILTVTDREPAYFTYFGCKRNVKANLTRMKLDAISKELKSKAKIEKSL